MPSEKYSFSLSSLRFVNASTAMLFSGMAGAGVVIAGAGVEEAGFGDVPDFERRNWNASKPAAARARLIISAANFRRLHCGITSSGETFSVRFNPSGVISKAQARTSAIGKPSNVSTTTALVITSGRWSAGTTVAATCITSQPTTAYATATL